jgi:ketosteroid isomerase-like protein
MMDAKEILHQFYTAVVKRDFAAARRCLSDDLVFVGLFETYRSANHYIAALTGLMSITVRLDVKTIIAEGNDAAVFFRAGDECSGRSHRLGRRMAPLQERQDRPRRIGFRWPTL